ncbi:MAG: hypothetical protein H6737_14625 [Alphaproteobacteria bacterium]|nr:hypothetical protein [Alphaproteobacteria bacterium]
MWWLLAAQASDITVPGTVSDLTAALALAVDGDRILLGPGSHTDANLRIEHAITIEGAGQGTTTLYGGAGATVVDIAVPGVVLRDLTVDGGGVKRGLVTLVGSDLRAERVTVMNATPPSGTSPGGGLGIFEGSAAILVDVRIENANGQATGGGIFLSDGTLDATGLVILNASAVDGGGIHVATAGSAVVSDLFIGGATATNKGGGIRVLGTLDLTDATLVGTSCPRGAGIDVEGTATLNRVWIEGASGNNEGSAIRVHTNAGQLVATNLFTCESTGAPAIDATSSAGLVAVSQWLSIRDGDTALRLRTGNNDVRNATIIGASTGANLSGGGDLRDSVVVNALTGATRGGASVVEGNLFDAAPPNGSVSGPPINDIGPSGLVGDTSTCATALFAYPTLSVVDLGLSGVLDVDGSTGDRGHLGGPELDIDFFGADADGDGALVHIDCDDLDPTRSPFVPDVACNGIDEDCDGADGVPAFVTHWADDDGDGYGNPEAPTSLCSDAPGFVDNDLDCDDSDASIDPDTAWYADTDADGYGDPASLLVSCLQPGGYVANDLDCDDTSDAVSPLALETCNGIDDDCDGLPDDSATGTALWWPDSDLDGFGDPQGASLDACSPGPGWSLEATDCDDGDASVSPAAVERCATPGVDDDCNGLVDLDDSGVDDAITVWADGDGDGWGAGDGEMACVVGPAQAGVDGDCDDGDASVSPGSDEVCNGEDDDCDGAIDDDDDDLDLSTAELQYPDADGDGFGGEPGVWSCGSLPDHVAEGGDCDDGDPSVNPDGTEVWYNDVDEDCDGNDRDQDNDGYALLSDCDDTDPSISPDAVDVPDNGIDEDCDGADAEGDGARIGNGCGCNGGGGIGPFAWLAALLLRRRRPVPWDIADRRDSRGA